MSFVKAVVFSYLITGLMVAALFDAIVLQRLPPWGDATLMLASVVSFIAFGAALEWEGEALGAGGGGG